MTEPTTKKCRVCEVVKPVEKFGMVDKKRQPGRRRATCVSCESKRVHEYRNSTPERLQASRDRTWRSVLKQNFKLTVEGYEKILAGQGGGCAICGSDSTTNTKDKKRLAVDHCHITGKIRGILCDKCNVGLARFRDSPALLKAAAAYVERQAD